MKIKRIGFLLAAALILALAILSGFNQFQDQHRFNMNYRFGRMENYEEMIPIEMEKVGELNYYLTSSIEKGSISMLIISPEEDIVRDIKGSEIKERGSIPLTSGIWYIKLALNDNKIAENGRVRLKASVR